MSKQSEYTYSISSERVSIPPTIVKVTASSIEDACEKMWELHKYKGYTLTHIDGEKYIPEDEDLAPSLPDPEERYWKAVTTWAERHSHVDDWD